VRGQNTSAQSSEWLTEEVLQKIRRRRPFGSRGPCPQHAKSRRKRNAGEGEPGQEANLPTRKTKPRRGRVTYKGFHIQIPAFSTVSKTSYIISEAQCKMEGNGHFQALRRKGLSEVLQWKVTFFLMTLDLFCSLVHRDTPRVLIPAGARSPLPDLAQLHGGGGAATNF
jgi:hypothetical protein